MPRFRYLFFVIIGLIIFNSGIHSFAQTDSSKIILKVNDLLIIGNTITKQSIILRELTFQKGDTIDSVNLAKILQRSKENVYNTSLFNSVEINYYHTNGNDINIVILLKERWYWWPIPIFEIHERNFNEWWLTKNFDRVVYGGYLVWNNFRGRNETLSLSLRDGYYHRYDLNYTIPYINKQQKVGLGFGAGYTNNHEIIYNVIDNKQAYYKNFNIKALEEYSAEARVTKRDGIYNTHTLFLDYKFDRISDSVVSLNHDYFLNGKTSQQYFSIAYQFEQDYRDIKIYPLKGYYYTFMVQQLGFVEKGLNITYLKGAVRKYWKLSEPFYFECGLNGRLSSTYTNQPFFLQSSLGYGNDYVRGYEYYVVNGQSFGLARAELKWQLFSPKVFYLPFIPAEKFNSIPVALYLTAFGDAGYAKDKFYGAGNPLANDWLLGSGVGLDLVTYYNVVWRFEYSVNRMKETGFFLHFTAPL